jgi:hypothetical protein
VGWSGRRDEWNQRLSQRCIREAQLEVTMAVTVNTVRAMSTGCTVLRPINYSFILNPEDGSDMFVRNVSFPWSCIASQFRRCAFIIR